MNPPDLDWRQYCRLRGEFGVVKTSNYTLLTTFADQLAASDVEAIHDAARQMLEGGYFHDTRQLPLVGPQGFWCLFDDPLVATANSNGKRMPVYKSCLLRLFRWFAPVKNQQPGRIAHTEQKVVVLYLQNQQPWLVDWTGDSGPPPPASSFPKAHQGY